ncbi:tetratricopeptide repeat protein [Streptomyces sp. NBC_01198]|uniref:tetratricopeptide repeat protein n=1 Tax=Streptomyces sp. NBC_01198 TaxID=2903769 RepID=UPI002E0FB6CF|nr:tetratricopeptide repeat protein [Streptomyces sp. NBC_01198]
MARQRVTRQELNRRKSARGFVGRTEKLTMFRDNLGRNPQDEDFQYLFHVHGNAGVGKTSLVRQWENAAQAREAQTVYLDDDVHGPLEAMEAIGVQMERQGLPLRAFQDLLATYRLRRHEAETAPQALGAADPSVPGQASVTGTVVAQAGVLGLSMLPVPGAGALAGVLDPQQVAQSLDHSADRLRAMVASRLRSHDDVQLVISPLRVLTPVFLQDLGKAAERRPWVVFFFDVFERTGPLLNEWLSDVLVGEEYGTLPLNVIAVLSGQGRLDARHWADHQRLIWDVPLEVFTHAEARELLAAHGIVDEQVVEVIVRLTGRLPVLVDLLAQTRPQDPTDVEDPADTAVDRFLKWITDPARRDAALACALPLHLDEDVYRAAVPEAAAEQYTWLRGLPFVTGREGRARYHDVVRTPMLRLQRGRSAARWQQQHLRLADAYRRWREEREPGDDPEGQEHRLSEAYHRLCANPATGWPAALPHLVAACDQGIPVLRRWAQILTQAGHDSPSAALTSWGNRLQVAAGDEANGTVTALTHLLAAPELTPAARALAHTLRGRDHRMATRYDLALTDYAAALALAPDLPRAHYGRGETHRLAGQYDQALASLTRAVELEPDEAVNIACRGLTYCALERYDDALTDFTAAIQLHHISDWLVANRGEAHRLAGNYDDALTDFNRAIEIAPLYAWAIASRGQTHRALGRYEDALTDHDRAIQLDPASDWIVAARGETHRLAGNYDDALTDFNRAIQLNPASDWTIASRGQTYRALQRYDDALTDFNRAIELNPNAKWMIGSRGETHRLAGNYDDALTDFDRAIQLNPASDWNIASRGRTCRAVGRYEEAFAELSRAIELDAGDAAYHADMALILHLLGRPEEPDHWRTARELLAAEASAGDSPGGRVRAQLMAVHCALGEWNEAAAELDRFLACGPRVWHIRDALDDLAELDTVLALDPAALGPLRQKLHDAQAALSCQP